MKRFFVTLLALMLTLSLCACGGAPEATLPAATEAPPVTEAPTEPVPDVTLYVMVNEDWLYPCCWAWKDGGADVFEAWPGQEMSWEAGWYTVQVPGWVDFVVINGNDGAIQTADLALEPGKDVWIHVVNEDYVYISYEEPTQEQLEQQENQPQEDYHAAFFRGNYQITGLKAVGYSNSDDRFTTRYVPEELLAQTPQEAYYCIRIVSANQQKGYYMGPGTMISAVQLGVRIQIEEMATGKILATSDDFLGGEPPETISMGDSGTGTPPDAYAIEAWILQQFETILQNPPTDQPFIPLNEDALTDEEKACMEAIDLANRFLMSKAELLEWLVEYEHYSQADAQKAVDNCGVDFKQIAALAAKARLDKEPSEYSGYASRAQLQRYLTDSDQFTQEEAEYALAQCDVDWKERALMQAKWLTDDEDGFGYSQRDLRRYLVGSLDEYGYGFIVEEANYAAENCNADWNKEAVKAAAFVLEYGGRGQTKAQVVEELMTFNGFTEEQATYGAEMNGLK